MLSHCNTFNEIVQLKEVHHTFGHVSWLREDGVSERGGVVGVCNTETISFSR